MKKTAAWIFCCSLLAGVGAAIWMGDWDAGKGADEGRVYANSAIDLGDPRTALEGGGYNPTFEGLLEMIENVELPLSDRYLAVRALADFEEREVDDRLTKVLVDKEADLRYAAALGLRERRAEGLEDRLLPSLDDPSPDVQRLVIRALGESGGAAAARALEERLADRRLAGDNAPVAAAVLGEIGSEASLSSLQRAVDRSLALECPEGMSDAACLDLHLQAAVEREEWPIAEDCSANSALAADLRAAAAGSLAVLGDPEPEARAVLGALHPCTAREYRTLAVASLENASGRTFTRRGETGAIDAETLAAIAAWWTDR